MSGSTFKRSQSVARLGRRESLVGTGGTLRNLAKIDRSGRVAGNPDHRTRSARIRGPPLSLLEPRLHGRRGRSWAIDAPEKRRDDIAGLSAESRRLDRWRRRGDRGRLMA
jgi:hypothetical protein